MERRMEASRKQADVITDMEDQLSKARQQEVDYQKAMEQLQGELGVLEQENSKLKQNLNNVDRQGKPCALFVQDCCLWKSEVNGSCPPHSLGVGHNKRTRGRPTDRRQFGGIALTRTN